MNQFVAKLQKISDGVMEEGGNAAGSGADGASLDESKRAASLMSWAFTSLTKKVCMLSVVCVCV